MRGLLVSVNIFDPINDTLRKADRVQPEISTKPMERGRPQRGEETLERSMIKRGQDLRAVRLDAQCDRKGDAELTVTDERGTRK